MSRSWRRGFPRGVTRVTGLTALVGGLLLVAAALSGSARAPGHRPLAARQLARVVAAPVSCTPGSPEQNLPQNGFTCPVKIPNSSGLGELIPLRPSSLAQLPNRPRITRGAVVTPK